MEKEILIVAILAAAIKAGTPILYATLGEIFTERSGVLNQYRIQALGTTIPSFFLKMFPYIFTIIVLVIATQETIRRRIGAPANLGLPYYRGEKK